MINQLKPYYVGEKIRLGRTNDGGYVLPKQLLHDSECLFSYGINNDITFDEHYIQLTNKKVYGYDHTIEGIHTEYPSLFTWYKKGLSGTPQEQTDNFLNHYKELGISGKVLLKVDIECYEYEWLENTDIERLADVCSGLVIEFHSVADEHFRNRFIAAIENLNKHFYLCHIHGNNYGGTFNYEGYAVPDVLELTFISKAIVKDVQFDTATYPTELDSPNYIELKDHYLTFINK
jgi:hypothetical protein